jgi:hypothetical protein
LFTTAVADDAKVDPQLDAVTQRIQAPRRVLAVQPQIQGEVVVGPDRDDQQRHIMLGGDAGDQRLGRIPAGHPSRSAPGHRRAGELTHVHDSRPLQQGDSAPLGRPLAGTRSVGDLGSVPSPAAIAGDFP